MTTVSITDAELWLPIPGTSGRYEVSDLGRIRSYATNGKKRRTVPRILKTRTDSHGYTAIMLGRRTNLRRVHQLVMAAFVGPQQARIEVRHLDGDKTNNALANLAYGTRSENVLDSVKHGTHPSAGMKRKECLRGHPFTDENTRWIESGTKRQRRCLREWDRQYRKRKALS